MTTRVTERKQPAAEDAGSDGPEGLQGGRKTAKPRSFACTDRDMMTGPVRSNQGISARESLLQGIRSRPGSQSADSLIRVIRGEGRQM